MPKYSPYQRQKVQEEKDLAVELYKQGMPAREVAKRIGRSHTFVTTAVKKSKEK